AAARLDGWLREAQSVDTALDGLERLAHGRCLRGGNGAGSLSQQVAIGLAGCGTQIPAAAELGVDKVAKRGGLRRIQTLDNDVRVVSAANFVVANILLAQLRGQVVDGDVRFLRDRFLHLDL